VNTSRLVNKASQFSCAYEKNGHVGVLTVSGVLTPDCLPEINMRLRDSMKDADFVVVNIDKVVSIDAEIFSLFCISVRMAYSENKRLHLGHATQEQQTAASRMCSSNFSEAARHDCAMHCFWLDQTSEDGTSAVMDMREN
jgi:ABC-type transporter Mla MlaB component